MIHSNGLSLSVNWIAESKSEKYDYRLKDNAFNAICMDSVRAMKAGYTAYVFTHEQAQTVIAKAPFEVAMTEDDFCIALRRVKA